jgi:hypothetical protein
LTVKFLCPVHCAPSVIITPRLFPPIDLAQFMV